MESFIKRHKHQITISLFIIIWIILQVCLIQAGHMLAPILSADPPSSPPTPVFT